MHSWIDIPLRDGKDADEWELTESKAIANIDQWYQEGRLLFPRDSLQEVRDQLRKPLKKGDSIYVKGFDGSMYEWPVKTGNIKTHWEADNNTGEEKQVDWMLLVLEKSDIKVLEDPEGFLEMDDASLVFSCSPNICVKEIVVDIARPLALIWCTVKDKDPEHAL
ncbi:hypothetical protein KXW29_004631 [Aspergillus fumigatus]|uniref:Uncharacterized protein n=2 Tax=Aspergillus fumigatus TaxID=746128 RepID=Q4WL57_ASPFU|nr:hypothetical protein AFUA_1G00110 [Aspergillus fumigatus Af293]EAL87725.1 hypothetical protein AFUA_1G00110 [Aspergillus fumigatus Af293]KAH1895880.1 hypothetical protein KXV57_001687 [Aspergillus fumigatus]KAH2270979.1 hypothetical protein KXW02_001384 [Aspergillus fumigatus]KAH2726167.1 hypothetical protein KXW29_004631 [Aspergillus fumigatus]